MGFPITPYPSLSSQQSVASDQAFLTLTQRATKIACSSLFWKKKTWFTLQRDGHIEIVFWRTRVLKQKFSTGLWPRCHTSKSLTTLLPSCLPRVRGLPVTRYSGYWGHQAKSVTTDELAAMWRNGARPAKNDMKSTRSKHAQRKMILTTLVQFKTFTEKCFLKMRQSVIGCKCIPLHPHVLQLLILTIRTLQMNHTY